SAQLVVTSPFEAGGYRSAPMSDAIVADIQRVPGVATAIGEQERDLRYGDQSVLLASADPPCFLDRRVCDWGMSEGSLEALRSVANGEGVLVSQAFANLHGTRPGDELVLPTARGPQSFRVAAITSSQPQSAVLMSRSLYRRLWNDDLVPWIRVAVAEGNTPEAVAEAIAKGLGQTHRLRILTSAAMVEHFAQQARQAFSVLYLAEAIALLLVLVGIGDTLAAGVSA